MKTLNASAGLIRNIILSNLLWITACEKSPDTGSPVNGKVLMIEDRFSLSSSCNEMYLTSKADALGRPFLYVAAKEGGLKIFSLGGNSSPVATVATSSYGSLHVMNLSQSGNYLYLALGNHFGNAQQSPGMAIINVSDPAHPALTGFWSDNSKTGGAGIVESSGNYAYLGAMGNGLIIFDISNRSLPVVRSVLIPDIGYPDPHPDPKKYNARGMAVINDLVYLCYDAGGMRIINVSDKMHPFESGRYSNPDMNGKPRAYNNVVIDGSLAYLAVDYCGMEVVNISNPAACSLISWWNPWNCQASPLNWFTSNGHCNEIAMDKTNHLVFMSSGKSDLQVVNVTDAGKPVLAKEYGGTGNNIGTWGVSVTGNQVYLTYICSFIPFSSNWTGVKVLDYSLR